MKPLIEQFDVGANDVQSIVKDTLKNADDGELFLEYRESESLLFDNGRLKNGSFNQDKGFGLRAVADEATGYAHSGELTKAALKRASDAAKAVTNGYQGTYSAAPRGTNKKLYDELNPLNSPSFEAKVALLKKIDSYIRNKNDAVRQVSVSLAGSLQQVEILRADGELVRDVRPLVRLAVSVVAGKGDRLENGFYGCGGRQAFDRFIAEDNWQMAADEALRMALVNLEAEPA
ncbi:TldD/PmbA family protein, partial [Bartonella apis]